MNIGRKACNISVTNELTVTEMFVYLLRNKSNGKCYVGQTTREPNRRFAEHISESKTHRENMVIGRAIAKYGWEGFDKFVLQVCTTRDDLDAAEAFWIIKMNSMHPKGYNSSYARFGSNAMTNETRQKISKAISGIKRSDETKRKTGDASRGRRHSFDDRMYIRDSTGKSRKNTSELQPVSFKRSDEFRKRISELKSGEKHHNACLTWEKVREIRKRFDDGESIYELALQFKCSPSNISMIGNNKTWKENLINQHP